MSRNSFIVRVYEQTEIKENKDEEVLTMGIVEDADSGVKRAFHNRDELWVFISERQQKTTEKVKT